jgi:poly-gamma-glutamate synthesis protein (capsule biosynthesis protein)
MKSRLASLSILFYVAQVAGGTSPVAAETPAAIPSMYRNAGVFEAAIAKEEPARRFGGTVTGITVPHHLLAADLIARGFWIDRAVTAALTESPLFAESNLFEQEHGIQAELPFIKHFFPDAKIVPIAVSGGSSRSDWDAAISLLARFADDKTLIVQSTDYSHYLPLEVAVKRDQESLNVIAARWDCNRPSSTQARSSSPIEIRPNTARWERERRATSSPPIWTIRNPAQA